MKRAWVVGLALLSMACSGELTELLVVIDSDLPVPSGIDAVRVTASGAESMSAEGTITNEDPLPRTVGIVHRGGELGPIEVTVVGARGGEDVVRAQVTTAFIRGRTLVLPIFLSSACVSDPQACVTEVDPSTLDDWTGTLPGRDAGPRDAGPDCTPADEACNGEDDDCDGRVDEGFDFQSDPQHCGACDNACTTACVDGACAAEGCEDGFGDCDGDPSNGCEAELSSAMHCGACDNACSFANATGMCVDASCALGACRSGFGDCNGDPRDGCERELNTFEHCGACGAVCAPANGTGMCDDGDCEIVACEPGFDDCDGDPRNGCETSLTTLSDCGACGDRCRLDRADETCATGTCQIASCNWDFADCDGDPSNGCEVDTDDDDDHCGMCGVVCDFGDDCRNGTCR